MIIVRIWEGLGNQLFQYAFARALQLKTGKKVLLDASREYKNVSSESKVERPYRLDHFKITLNKAEIKDLNKYKFLKQDNLLRKINFYLATHSVLGKRYYEETYDNFLPDYINIQWNSYIRGWFQNEKYFKKYRNIIIREIVPQKKIKIGTELKNVLKNKETVAIHIRRGDYKVLGNMLPVTYYQRAIDYMNTKIANPYYCIFSDEISWVKENMDFGDNVYFVSKNCTFEDYEELMIMSKCKNFIISNSTFSWWGAWLCQNNKKIVIAPKHWFYNKTVEDNYCITPKEWVRI